MGITVLLSVLSPGHAARFCYAGPIPKTAWRVVFVDSEETSVEDGNARNAFDDDPDTLWVTSWSGDPTAPPHELQIDLGDQYALEGFRYLPPRRRTTSGDTLPPPCRTPQRSGARMLENRDKARLRAPRCRKRSSGRIRDFELYVSTSPERWGSPVVRGRFRNSKAEKAVRFPARSGRYVRLRALSSARHALWTAVAEITLVAASGSTTTTTLPPAPPDKALWRRWFVDSEELAAGNHPATAAFDADPATYWRSEFSVYNATHPHELQLNLGGLYTLTGFRYLPPQDGSTAGRINGFALYTSLDGTTWGSPVATGTLANSAAEQSVAFAPTVAQYVRLVSQSGHNADRSAAIAELTLLGTCVVPSVALVRPQRYDLTPTADLGVLVNTCYDPVLHAGWGVQLTLDATTVRPLFTAPFSTTFSGLLPGEHTLEAMALDATATPVPGPDTQELVTAAATGGRYTVAVGDSITYGIGDNVPTDDISPDGRDRSRGYPPILNGLLTTATGGLPHTVANEGVPGAKTSWGATVLPNLLAKHASAERVVVLLGTNDSNVFAPVPSGLGLNPGDPGYPGTVKANLQAALDAINAAGKSPVLLKLPPALARCSTCAPYPDPDQGDKNVNFIKPYNQVIDELVANPANNVTIPPPDLYAYFLARPELYADFLHPTGVGYQHLARLVCQALTQTPCGPSP